MTLTQQFLDQILYNIDKNQLTSLKKESKKLTHLGDTNFNDLNQNQKNMLLKSFDKLLNNNYKLLNNDLDVLFNKGTSFNDFFKITRLPRDDSFSLFWDHIQLVDALNNDLNQQNFNNLQIFLANFGALKIQDQTLDVFWNEAISLKNSDILAQSVFGLSLYSLLSHLDILIHRSIFQEIEPICLGWFFQKKLNPKTFQWKDGKMIKISKHKAIWTNPSRSLLTLMATFAALNLDDEKPLTCHGLNFSNYLLNYTERKENFIKKANEGFSITYTDFHWLLSDTVDRDEIHINNCKRSSRETLNILLNRETQYKSNNTLFLLWLVYRFFQNDYESRPEGTAYMHGIYYEFWDFFSDFYAKTGSNTLTSQWPTDLQKLAQPPSN